MPKKFVQIEAGNDWGAVYYAYAGKALDKDGKAGRERGLKLKEGASVKVEWPSGKVTTEKLVRKPFTASVSDHGHSTSFETAHWGVDAAVHGVKVFVDLCTLKVEEGSL